jgi:hypothetical protein
LKLSPQATATYQQYLKAKEMCDKLEEKEQKVVYELLNGDLRFDPSTRTTSPSR